MKPVDPPANGATSDSMHQELVAENQRLRTDLDEARQRIASLEADRDGYHKLATDLLAQQCREEDWADFNPDDYTIPVSELIADAEAMHKSGE
jgi:hypothetical protein